MVATKKSVRKQWLLLALLLVISVGLMVAIYFALFAKSDVTQPVNSYDECIKNKNALLLETYPEQCVVDGKSFTNPNQSVPAADQPAATSDDVLSVYKAKNPCSAPDALPVTVKKQTTNGWAELSAGCEPGSGHLEVWKKVGAQWQYVIGFQDGPYCEMVVDKQISKELYPTCLTLEAGPTSELNENGQAVIPNQIP